MKILSNKPLLCTLLCIVVSLTALAQQKGKYPINQLNKEGKKEGLWIETTSSERIEKYYWNGQLNGIYKKFNRDGKLITFGEYTNDTTSGDWYWWDGPRLSFSLSNEKKNDHAIVNQYIGEYIPDYKCYLRNFHPNGTIEEEGIILWDDDSFPLSDLATRYGQVRQYNDQKQLIRVELYLDGEIL